MYRNRHQTDSSCTNCPHANLCIAKDLDDTHKARLDTLISKTLSLKKGAHLYHQNDKMDNLYAVRSGVLKDYQININGSEFISDFYFPGDILGLESVTLRYHAYSAAALSEVTLCIIPLNKLFNEMHHSPTLLKNFAQIYSNRFIANKYIRPTTNAKQRVADFLIAMLDRLKLTQGGEDLIQLPMSQQDMGNMLGIAYETVSRVLRHFEQQQIIQISNKRIKIANRHRLAQQG